jgi:oligosaccharyltransferase complex subunit delta (ribophorin II)
MVHFIRTLILVLSTATLSLAASSWSLSDATIAVGPKGKEATSLRTYSFPGN